MKRFIGFIKKEFYHIFRDRRSLFILFGMPIAQILLFGFAITNEINNVDIAILDHSKDASTEEIINKISASKYFTVKQILTREADIETAFKKGKIKAVLNFEKHNYIYMCADPNHFGFHKFTDNPAQHAINAKAYQDWLNSKNITQ